MKKTVARGAMALAGTAVAAASWCLLLRPRTNQPGWEKLQGVRYAHRASTTGPPGSLRTPWRPSAGRWRGALARSWTCT